MKTISDIQADFKKQIAARHREPSDAVKLDPFRTDDDPFPGAPGSPAVGAEPPPPALFAPADVGPTDHPDPIVDMVLTAIVSAVVRGDKATEATLRASLTKYMQSTRGA